MKKLIFLFLLFASVVNAQPFGWSLTPTTHGVIIGNGNNPIAWTTAGTSGQILTSGGSSADPGWTTLLPPANGGTGIASPPVYNIPVYNGTAGWDSVGAGTAGQILKSGGASAKPLWITSVPVANGGTGGTTLATGQLGLGAVYKSLASNYTNATTSLTDVTGLSLTVAASEHWVATFTIKCNGADANGLKFGFTFPSGGTMMGVVNGNVATITAYSSDVMTTTATAGIAYATSSATGSVVIITVDFLNSTTPGTLQLQALKVTSGTATIYGQSSMLAFRVL